MPNSEIVNELVMVSFKDKWLEFVGRSEPSFDITSLDKIVIKEIFHENVYAVEQSDINEGTVIDIGANVGAFTIFASVLGAKRILSLEPDSFNYNILVDNIGRNNLEGIEAIKLGVLDKESEVDIINGQGASFVIGSRELSENAQKNLDEVEHFEETIKTISLNDVFEKYKVDECKVLKVDVEGSEYKIFQTVSEDVMKKINYITMEFHQTDETTFGLMLSKLSMTHRINVLGHHDIGGNLYAKRY